MPVKICRTCGYPAVVTHQYGDPPTVDGCSACEALDELDELTEADFLDGEVDAEGDGEVDAEPSEADVDEHHLGD